MADRASRGLRQGSQVARSRPPVSSRRGDAGPQMKVLLTGASSFTGYWFAHELHRVGRHVVAPLRGAVSDYQNGPRAERVRRLSSMAEVVEAAPFGSDRFMEVVKGAEFDVL